MQKFGMGQPATRYEDQRLLTGQGRYIDDVNLEGQLWGWAVRSPHAHARITELDVEAARSAPGVRAVYTVEDLDAAGVGDLPCLYNLTQSDGSPLVTPPRPALARERVRHVGDPVAFVVAETRDQAQEAADLVMVDYEMLPATTDLAGATQPDAAEVWSQAPGNICFDWDKGESDAVAQAFDRAARVVELDLVNNRVVANSIETRGAIGAVEPDSGRMVLHVSCQGVHNMRDALAKFVFKVDPARIHVFCPDVGGGFGMKIFPYPEYVLVMHAARQLGAPVKWIAERGEAFLSDDHGRDNRTHMEMALDEQARFLALRVDSLANMGAYLSSFAPFIPTDLGAPMLVGVYDIPAAHVRVRGVFTHTNPVDAYRGAGRPEAAYAIERLVDKVARETGLSPAEIRRRNFIRPEQMPYATAFGLTYDSGDFAANMDDALGLADWEGFEARRQAARQRGKLRGIGLSTYIESSAGGFPEEARVQIAGDGRVTLYVGTQSNGQGHETAFRQILAERLGVSFEEVTVVQGDSDRVRYGKGTGGSRSVPVGGAAVSGVAGKVVEQAKIKAGELLEAAEADIEFSDGAFRIVGTDRSVTLKAVAEAAAPADGGPSFDETERWAPPAPTFPNGTHICELEIDIETGVVQVLDYTVVDDFGKVLNPLLLAGQIHGGIAQGLGQALLENCVFDQESGQLLTGSFTDYTMPRADNMPGIRIKFNEVPCLTNALGLKGAGEAGAIGAPPAIINGLVDALSEFGVSHVDMPATAETLWRLIRERAARAA